MFSIQMQNTPCLEKDLNVRKVYRDICILSCNSDTSSTWLPTYPRHPLFAIVFILYVCVIKDISINIQKPLLIRVGETVRSCPCSGLLEVHYIPFLKWDRFLGQSDIFHPGKEGCQVPRTGFIITPSRFF